jgi:hypothetical protein
MERQTGQLRKMVREMARRDVDRFADASASNVDGGQAYGFQNKLLRGEMQIRRPPTVRGRWPEIMRRTD